MSHARKGSVQIVRFGVLRGDGFHGLEASSCRIGGDYGDHQCVTWAGSELFVEELRGGGGVHDVRPDLFFRSHRSFRHGVIGHPCVGLATGYEAEGACDEPSWHRSR